MNEGNKNLSVDYRYLSKDDFKIGHQTFLASFSDYVVPLNMTEDQFANHLVQNAVELERSVGAFAGEKMIGLTINGFGLWHGEPTVYDAGTGIIAGFRNLGAASGMFEFMMPDFKKNGLRQILLEVMTENEKACRLYGKLGFETTRNLIFYERASAFKAAAGKFEVREISHPDWELLDTFGAGTASWQNSFASFDRNSTRKIILGAFENEHCIGYGTVYCNSGIISQIAVAEPFRRRGVSTQLLAELQKQLGEDKKLKVSNVDASLKDVVGFLENCGFTERLQQFEMIKFL